MHQSALTGSDCHFFFPEDRLRKKRADSDDPGLAVGRFPGELTIIQSYVFLYLAFHCPRSCLMAEIVQCSNCGKN